MKKRVALGIFSLLILTGFIAVSQNTSKAPATPKTIQDTVPVKEKKIRDLDEAMKEVERAMAELNTELKKPLPPIPPIEMNKIKAELDQALKEVDPDKIKKEIEMAMKEIDGEKIKQQVQAALARVDMGKVKKEIERVREVELPKLEEELKYIRPQIEKSLAEAKESVEKAKTEIEEYKKFESDLEKDGLINKKENYSIEHKDGTLIINGKTQPAAVYNKYRIFLEKHKNFTWKKDSEGLEINNR